MATFSPFPILFFFLSLSISAFCEETYDLVIYGGTSSGVMAAVQAARMGKSCVVIEPSLHLGGMTGSGLGVIDKTDVQIFGGLTREYFLRAIQYYQNANHWVWSSQPDLKYQKFGMYTLEPHVAEQIFQEMANNPLIHCVFAERIDLTSGVNKKNGTITSIIMESGREFSGKMFIDASYVGDLMKLAGVSYITGRENNDLYGETFNGVLPSFNRSALSPGVDPYVIKGDPQSNLLPFIYPKVGQPGQEDGEIMAYNYRMCLTDVRNNQSPIEKPENYDEQNYELIFRAIEAGTPLYKFMTFSKVPNGKTDSNNGGAFSTDFVGRSWQYPEAGYKEREQIEQAHENWQRGLLWTLQNHPRVPENFRTYFSKWGLAKDEFVDHHHWPYLLYVRESRRMISEGVITEHTVMGKTPAVLDSVGLGSYPMDSHIVKYFVAPDGFIGFDGSFYQNLLDPYPISFRSIVPKMAECNNLLVPVCLSASHAAYGSLRTEPTFMILGQSAATAACLAIDLNLPIQDLPYAILQQRLLEDNQILSISK